MLFHLYWRKQLVSQLNQFYSIMSGYITEFFGYRASDRSNSAIEAALRKNCPFLGAPCTKKLSRDNSISGVCAIRQVAEGSKSIICCPNRLYAENYKLLQTIAKMAFKKDVGLYAGRRAVGRARMEGGAVAVFGKGWGGELRLPQRQGVGSYFVDWILALLNETGELEEITAIEVQTIDTTGSYQFARSALLMEREIVKDSMGLNWENVSKRIIPQLIYKGQVLQREELCKSGLYFVAPQPVFERVLNRLGGKGKLPTFPSQAASIHFISYDTIAAPVDGIITPLGVIEEYATTVYKVQEAFSSLDLPEGNVYRDAIVRSLYPERFQ